MYITCTKRFYPNLVKLLKHHSLARSVFTLYATAVIVLYVRIDFTRGAPIIGIGRLSAVLPIIGIGR